MEAVAPKPPSKAAADAAKWVDRTDLEMDAALRETLRRCGRPLVLTTVILVVGFVAFGLGQFEPNRSFGLLTSLVLTLALTTDLVLVPALLSLGRRAS